MCVISNAFCDFVFENNLSQLVLEPTHIRGNTLDLIFTVHTDLVDNVTVHPPEETPLSSDHFRVSFRVNTQHCISVEGDCSLVYDYPKADWEGLCNFLMDGDLDSCLELVDVEEVWAFIRLSVTSAMYQFIPRVKIRASQLPSWFTANLRHQLRSLRRRCNRHPTPIKLAKLKSCELSLQLASKQAKVHYERGLITKFVADNDCGGYTNTSGS